MLLVFVLWFCLRNYWLSKWKPEAREINLRDYITHLWRQWNVGLNRIKVNVPSHLRIYPSIADCRLCKNFQISVYSTFNFFLSWQWLITPGFEYFILRQYVNLKLVYYSPVIDVHHLWWFLLSRRNSIFMDYVRLNVSGTYVRIRWTDFRSFLNQLYF